MVSPADRVAEAAQELVEWTVLCLQLIQHMDRLLLFADVLSRYAEAHTFEA